MHMPTLVLNTALLEHSELSVLNESRNFWLYDRMGFLMFLSAEELWPEKEGVARRGLSYRKACLFSVLCSSGQTGLALRCCQLSAEPDEWKGRVVFMMVSCLRSQEENLSWHLVPDSNFCRSAAHGSGCVTSERTLWFWFVWPTSGLLISKCSKSPSPPDSICTCYGKASNKQGNEPYPRSNWDSRSSLWLSFNYEIVTGLDKWDSFSIL